MPAGSRDENDTDRLQFNRKAIYQEVAYRRDKQWRIFSWTATLLLGAIGGVIALTGREEFFFPLWPARTIMAISLLVLTTYACRWIYENIDAESVAREELHKADTDLGISTSITPNPRSRPEFGYVGTLVLLAIGS